MSHYSYTFRIFVIPIGRERKAIKRDIVSKKLNDSLF